MEFSFSYSEFDRIEDLDSKEQGLVQKTRELCKDAYAPYSKFAVACLVQLQNGELIKGINIENASYPVGICAERAALSSSLSQFPDAIIEKMIISYDGEHSENAIPIFPCGMCRQFILECQNKQSKPIQLILSAQQGKVVFIDDASSLLPFAFDGQALKK